MATNQKKNAKNQPASRAGKNNNNGDMNPKFSILLFGLGLFFMLLCLISGAPAWEWIRQNILFGGFGISAWIIGPLFIYWAVLVGMQKSVYGEIIRGILLIMALSATVLVFGKIDFAGEEFGGKIRLLIESGQTKTGGGLISIIFGWTLIELMGRPAANFIIILIAVLVLMLFTGVTPADIGRFFKQTARKINEEMTDDEGGYVDEEYYYEPMPQPPLPKDPPPRSRKKRKADVDIKLDEAEIISHKPPNVSPNEKVDIGPGGTFGYNPLDVPLTAQEAVEKKSALEQAWQQNDDIIRPFDFTSSQSLFEEEKKGEPEVLLFGNDDPFNNPSKIVRGKYDVEVIEPENIIPEKEDFFAENNLGNDVLAGSIIAGTVQNAKKSNEDIFKNAAPLAPIPSKSVKAPDIFADETDAASAAKTNENEKVELFEENVQKEETKTFEVPPKELFFEEKPVKEEKATVKQQANVDGNENAIGEVDALIDKAAAEKADDNMPAADTRGAGVMQPYPYPPLNLFEQSPPDDNSGARDEMRKTADLLVNTLSSFGVQTRILDVCRGPSVTRYEIQPQTGVKISKITNLADDIALNLATAGVRIEAPIPGKPAVGIEVPNKIKSMVSIRTILENKIFAESTAPLTIALGKDIAGECVVADLAKMPHLLIAGSTGSGKSVCVNSIIMSLLFKSGPEETKLLLIDPKVVELAEYNGIPHLLMPVITEARKAAGALGAMVAEMEKRYHMFAEYSVRDIKSFNKLAENQGLEKMPYIAIVIDELADLMMVSGKEVEDYICRIAQKARAAGMHLIVATQRPSVDVITGLIKANIPSRIAFAVSSQIDSRTILDGGGAEKLLGMGDMLFMPVGANKPVRVQGTYVKDREISAVLNYVKGRTSSEYDEGLIQEMERRSKPEGGESAEGDMTSLFTDETFCAAVDLAFDSDGVSTSFLQRRLSLGYARAGRMVDQMEQLGIVGPPNGSKPREMLIDRQQWLEMSMNSTD